MNILYGLTGSVASILLVKIKQQLIDAGHIYKFVLTQNAERFVDTNRIWPFFDTDKDEWYRYEKKGEVRHIDLIKWADKFIIGPCSANTLAKIANGICDNLLTCCARAWDFSEPFVIAPAMNTKMWEHPITKEHIDKVKSWGIKVVEPIEKTLFCGDTGIGAMAKIEDILA